ncbi:hypothetical protein HBH98_172260 [Parastagonospora nodorum]|nr:hypothetical protein HBI10_235590 [Parastagonospora nodorum]KAH4008861.1 hypothetical protein HBI13_227260 [Parastagonospora nodorum]KAH4163699.1 hypothetical protein HBH43_153980 [Parastagonospora nodorum]KAH4293820.1 hypothetical protein HBI01_169900 [Parastagonospora nodorum]KAH4296508.1 hypothetical protein HBI02_168730 [Parastagonospora nodorum]
MAPVARLRQMRVLSSEAAAPVCKPPWTIPTETIAQPLTFLSSPAKDTRMPTPFSLLTTEYDGRVNCVDIDQHSIDVDIKWAGHAKHNLTTGKHQWLPHIDDERRKELTEHICIDQLCTGKTGLRLDNVVIRGAPHTSLYESPSSDNFACDELHITASADQWSGHPWMSRPTFHIYVKPSPNQLYDLDVIGLSCVVRKQGGSTHEMDQAYSWGSYVPFSAK